MIFLWNFINILRSFNYKLKDTEGDRMIMPQSILEEIQNLHTGNLMIFKISRIKDDEELFTHGGVLEFTSEEGIIEIPKKIQRKLEIHENDMDTDNNTITIEYVNLSKGKFVRFEPLDPQKFYKLPDPRAHLQSILVSSV